MTASILAPFQALADLVEVFQSCRVPYLVGGSVASSLFGRFRTTNDIDCLVDVSSVDLKSFVHSLTPNFIVDSVALRRELELGRSYNVIHDATFVKIDFFPVTSKFHRQELERAIDIHPDGAPSSFRVATAEDILLSKLVWLKKTGGTSERQIRDLEGIVAVKGVGLDREYLFEWADTLGVSTDLQELIRG